jgi:hypothetical protein
MSCSFAFGFLELSSVFNTTVSILLLSLLKKAFVFKDFLICESAFIAFDLKKGRSLVGLSFFLFVLLIDSFKFGL